jgi:transposase
MGRRTDKQAPMWVGTTELPRSPGHRFYEKLNELLRAAGFDKQVEALCESSFDAGAAGGRLSVVPGVYFRMLLVGYFEGIESERGLEWRCSDSLSLRGFLGLLPGERVPDHSTLSRTRTRLPSTVYEAVFTLVLGIVEKEGLLRGRVVGVDSTYLRADASMKTIVRRDTGEGYAEYLKKLCVEQGIENPTAEDAQRMDRQRKGKKVSNADWVSSTDDDARICRLKDGRTRLAYKAEHVVDMESGVVVAAELLPADSADTATLATSLEVARTNIEVARGSSRDSNDDDDNDDDDGSSPPGSPDLPSEREVMEVVADKGYHKAESLLDLARAQYRTYIPSPRVNGARHWGDKGGMLAREAFYSNRARCQRKKGKRHQRTRGELIERTFAHVCETGGHRRVRLRGQENVRKRYLLQVAAFNLGIVMRRLVGAGTPRQMAGRRALLYVVFVVSVLRLWCALFTLRLGTIFRAATRAAVDALDERELQNARLSTGC